MVRMVFPSMSIYRPRKGFQSDGFFSSPGDQEQPNDDTYRSENADDRQDRVSGLQANAATKMMTKPTAENESEPDRQISTNLPRYRGLPRKMRVSTAEHTGCTGM